MTLIDDHQEILREEVQEAVGTRTRSTSVEITRIILNAAAMPQFPDHLHVVGHTLLDSLRFDRTSSLLKVSHLLGEVLLNLVDGSQGTFLGGHEQVGRVYLIFFEFSDTSSVQRVHLFNAVDLIVPEADTQHMVGIGQVDIHIVAPHPEVPTVQRHVVPDIQAIDQSPKECIPVQDHALSYFDDIIVEVGRVSHAIDTAYR